MKTKVLFTICIIEAVAIVVMSTFVFGESDKVIANQVIEDCIIENCTILNCTIEDSNFKDSTIHNTPVTVSKEYVDKAMVTYDPVNFRSEPSLENGNIKYQLSYGSVVEVIEVGEQFSKVFYKGDEGYLFNDSIEVISSQRVLFDVSDYQWGSEYSSVAEFKSFTQNALNNCNFGGYYIQVLNYDTESKHWKDLVEVLEEMKIPYGLYFYTAATTENAIAKDYEFFKKICNTMELKYNLLPLMVDLEKSGDQSEVIRYMNRECSDEYIVYASASNIVEYQYYKLASNLWVAHYGKTSSPIPNVAYEKRNTGYVGFIPKVWQYTDKGNKYLFGTTHLDLNIVDEDWYRQFVK